MRQLRTALLAAYRLPVDYSGMLKVVLSNGGIVWRGGDKEQLKSASSEIQRFYPRLAGYTGTIEFYFNNGVIAGDSMTHTKLDNGYQKSFAQMINKKVPTV